MGSKPPIYAPFELEDPWRASSLLLAVRGSHSIFEDLEPSLPPLEPITDQVSSALYLDWDLPDLSQSDGALNPSVEQAQNDPFSPSQPYQNAQSSTGESEASFSIWDAPECMRVEKPLPSLLSWSRFDESPLGDADSVAYLSEAGPLAFDAALCILQDCSRHVGVLPRDHVLRALCNMALGRSSTFFQWNPASKRFVATLGEVPASGLSPQSNASFWAGIATFGSSLIELRDFTDGKRSSSDDESPTMLALKSGISSVVSVIDESISQHLYRTRSMIQLQRLIERPARLIRLFIKLADAAKICSSEEELISQLADVISLGVHLNPDYSSLLQSMLARIATPWLDQIRSDVGLQSSVLNTTSAHVQSGLADNSFVGEEDRRRIEEAKNTLKLLKDLSHDLSLTQASSVVASNPYSESSSIDGCLGRTAVSVESVGIPGARTTQLPGSLSIPPSMIESEVSQQGGAQWLDASQAMTIPELTDGSAEDLDELYACTRAILEPQDDGRRGLGMDLQEGLITSPFDRLRPALKAHTKLLNGILLRHLFRSSHLKQHLQLQRSFHLFGNGDFVVRLCTALFSAETQVAERKRGGLPTAGVIGLRLGSSQEQRWPPASSELQLTLMGILNEVYQPGMAEKHTSPPRHTAGLPGGLNFSIRELPDSEIERTLDPRSIYALDFLRLQYAAPPPVDAILTPDSMRVYDGIFRWLLRLLRLVHVTSSIQRRACERNASAQLPHKTFTSFAQATQHFVNVLASHVLDLGIEAPWHDFMTAVDTISQALDQEDHPQSGPGAPSAAASLSHLAHLHHACLERMRSRLFLKRSHTKVREALDAVLSTILSGSYAFDSPWLEVSQGDEEGRQRALSNFFTTSRHFCEVLHDHVDKSPKSGSALDAGDVDVAKLLLLRLRWNDR